MNTRFLVGKKEDFNYPSSSHHAQQKGQLAASSKKAPKKIQQQVMSISRQYLYQSTKLAKVLIIDDKIPQQSKSP